MTRLLLFITLLLFATHLWAVEFQESDSFQNTESFEEGIPSSWEVSKGKIFSSSKRYKQGGKALLWEWQKGDVLRLQSAQLALNSHAKNAGIAFWLYNTQISDDSLRFVFYDEQGKEQCAFYYRLNATGWRGSWIRFWQDMKGSTSPQKLVRMEIHAPAQGHGGSLFLDIVEFKRSIDYTRSPSMQHAPTYPYPEDIEVKDEWEAYLYESKYPRPYFPLPEEVTAKQKATFDTISRRIEDWLFGSDTYSANEYYQGRVSAMERFIAAGVKNYANFPINVDADGAMTGLPLFANKSSHSPKFGRDLGQKMLLQLALDYRINGNESSKDKAIRLLDYRHDQGWAYGSGIESLDHQKLRMMPWVYTIFLLRNALKLEKDDMAHSKYEREMDALRWFSGFHILFAPENDTLAVNVDDFRSTTLFRLLYILMMENDNPHKVQYMQHYTHFLNRNLKTVEGWSGGIKPDGMGYHHRAPYMNAYSNNGIHIMSQILYFIRHTEHDVAPHGKENLKRYMLNYRIISHWYDVPKGLSGRMSGMEKAVTMISPMAYLAHNFDEKVPDSALIAAMKRLWKPELLPVKNYINRYSASIMLRSTPGEIEVILKANQTKTSAESNPQGFWLKPYGALGVFKGADWSVSMKGTSAYVWDFESGNKENSYGRYDSYGQMETVHNTDKYPSLINSGYDFHHGWNWSRIPGTTTVNYDLDDLKSSTTRTFSPNTFVGGVTHKGRSGVWAMEFEDVHRHTDLKFNKAVFCFAPGLMVCLGSNISAQPGLDVESTIIQDVLSSSNNDYTLNGKVLTNDFNTQDKTVSILDKFGKGIIIPAGQDLKISVKEQVSKTLNEKDCSGKVISVWLENKQNDQYEYAIYMNASQEALNKALEKPSYRVLQNDKNAQIVVHNETLAYAIYNTAVELNEGILRKTSLPIMAMTSAEDGETTLSICNPDFNRSKPSALGDIKRFKDLLGPFPEMVLEVTLNGLYTLAAPVQGVSISHKNNNTRLHVKSHDAQTIELKLRKNSSSLNGNKAFATAVFPNPTNGSVHFPFCQEAKVYTADGRLLQKVKNKSQIDLSSYANGIYLLSLLDRNISGRFKLVKVY